MILSKTNPGVMLVLLGDGKEKPALQKQAAGMDLTNVLFLPPIPKMEMPAALAGADACLAILKPIEEYKTTYPNKVFDYMAAGRPDRTRHRRGYPRGGRAGRLRGFRPTR